MSGGPFQVSTTASATTLPETASGGGHAGASGTVARFDNPALRPAGFSTSTAYAAESSACCSCSSGENVSKNVASPGFPWPVPVGAEPAAGSSAIVCWHSACPVVVELAG